MVLRCAWGTCNTDVRYPDREPGVRLIRFPGPKREKQKCLRWIMACGRPHQQLNITKIDCNRAVCSKHFVGGNGPTEEFPDPVPAELYSGQPKPVKRNRKTVVSHSTSHQQPVKIEGPSYQLLQEVDLQHSTLGNVGHQEGSGHRSCATQTDGKWIPTFDVLALVAENKRLQQKVLNLEQQLSSRDAETNFVKQEPLEEQTVLNLDQQLSSDDEETNSVKQEPLEEQTVFNLEQQLSSDDEETNSVKQEPLEEQTVLNLEQQLSSNDVETNFVKQEPLEENDLFSHQDNLP